MDCITLELVAEIQRASDLKAQAFKETITARTIAKAARRNNDEALLLERGVKRKADGDVEDILKGYDFAFAMAEANSTHLEANAKLFMNPKSKLMCGFIACRGLRCRIVKNLRHVAGLDHEAVDLAYCSRHYADLKESDDKCDRQLELVQEIVDFIETLAPVQQPPVQQHPVQRVLHELPPRQLPPNDQILREMGLDPHPLDAPLSESDSGDSMDISND